MPIIDGRGWDHNDKHATTYLFHDRRTNYWDILIICDSRYKIYCPLSVEIKLLKYLILHAVW